MIPRRLVNTFLDILWEDTKDPSPRPKHVAYAAGS
jgi:hypothetical protein